MKNILKKYFCFLIFTLLIISSTVHIFYLKNLKHSDSYEVNSTIISKKIAYLTFDDGPSKNTDKILETLDKYNIKATFFVMGPSYNLKNSYLKKIVQYGHTLAIHSYEHNL